MAGRDFRPPGGCLTVDMGPESHLVADDTVFVQPEATVVHDPTRYPALASSRK